MTNQIEKARMFTAMHQPGKPIELYNVWDAGGARTLVQAGARAIATGSWSVAAAHGYADGQNIPFEFVLRIVARIVASVEVPVTLDFEGGYAEDPDTLARHTAEIINTGIVGINFEDQIVGGEGLFSITEQVDRIAAVRNAAVHAGVPLFINARTDLFLHEKEHNKHESLLPAARKRAEAYLAAGASGFFVPGLVDPELIGTLCRDVQLPVNIMYTGQAAQPRELAALGVARLSVGPWPYREAMTSFVAHYQDVFPT